MGFFSSLFQAAVFAAGTLVTKAAQGVGYVAAQVKNAYDRYRQTSGRGPRDVRRHHAAMADLNDDIIDLERKRQRDRRLSSAEEDRLEKLYERRATLRDEIYEDRELRIADDISGQQHAFDSVHVTDQNIHVLLFSVGQTVMGKFCSRCRRPMRLEWRQQGHAPSFRDFFWGCAGFYEGQGHTEAFTQQDVHLFTRTDRAEFTMSAQTLDRMLLLPPVQQNVRKRLSEVRNQTTEIHLCPIHNEPMVLREKKEAGGLMDQYFLSCPRWTDKACKQVVKIKSGGQLASLLEAHYGRGIL